MPCPSTFSPGFFPVVSHKHNDGIFIKCVSISWQSPSAWKHQFSPFQGNHFICASANICGCPKSFNKVFHASLYFCLNGFPTHGASRLVNNFSREFLSHTFHNFGETLCFPRWHHGILLTWCIINGGKIFE